MLYSINQKVRVRRNLKDIKVNAENNLWEGQEKMEGQEVLIIGARKTDYGIEYDVDGYGRSFPEEYLEPIKEVEYDGQIKGFVRAIDELGRVTIPIELRRAFDITKDDYLDMRIINKVIHLVKGSGRQLDKLGRYTIPIEFRKHLGITEGSQVDVYVDGEDLCIKKISVQCVDCGSTEKKLYEHNGVLLCEDCIKLFFGKVAFNG